LLPALSFIKYRNDGSSKLLWNIGTLPPVHTP
jgi:hypothetical protein